MKDALDELVEFELLVAGTRFGDLPQSEGHAEMVKQAAARLAELKEQVEWCAIVQSNLAEQLAENTLLSAELDKQIAINKIIAHDIQKGAREGYEIVLTQLRAQLDEAIAWHEGG